MKLLELFGARTLCTTNIAPKKWPSRKESSFPTTIFQRQAVCLGNVVLKSTV